MSPAAFLATAAAVALPTAAPSSTNCPQLFSASSRLQRSAEVRTQDLVGEWEGGLDHRTNWQPVLFHLAARAGGLAGTLDFPEQGRLGMPLKSVQLRGRELSIEWEGRSGLGTFVGSVEDGGIRGTLRQGDASTAFVLARVAGPNARRDPGVSGSYRVGRGRYVLIGNYERPYYLDTGTGRTGRLFACSPNDYFAGDAYAIPYPATARLTFRRSVGGEARQLVWQERGRKAVRASRTPFVTEKLTFQSGSARLSGTLYLPRGRGPHPVVVKVDPGYTLVRDHGYFPYLFLQNGVGMLTLTERLVGGTEMGYATASFEERAADIVAAVGALKSRPGVDPRRIGLHGSSLGAWVAPLAATKSAEVAFLILRSGSALPVPDNILYEVEGDLREAGFSEEKIGRAVALRRQLNETILSGDGWEKLKTAIDAAKDEDWFGYARVGWFSSVAIPPDAQALAGLRAPLGYDPRPVLERVTQPVLAINGLLDRAVNARLSVPTMEAAFRKGGNRDVTIAVLPNAGHDLLETGTGFGSEWYRLTRFAPGYLDRLTQWLRSHVTSAGDAGSKSRVPTSRSRER